MTAWTEKAWNAVDDAVRRLERAWKSAPSPKFPDMPPPGSALRGRMLVELVKVDQELRWQSGKPQRKRLKEYLCEWPELSEKPEVLAELVEAECVTRTIFGDLPTLDELRSDFPQVAGQIDLAKILTESKRENPRRRDGLGSHWSPGDPDATAEHIPAPPPPAAVDTADQTAGYTPSASSNTGVGLPLRVGQRFGRYEIRSEPKYGGMGVVYRAHDTKLKRDVALKIPRADRSNPTLLARFQHEALAAAAIEHANVCRIYDVDEIDGTSFMTMAWLEGMSLADRVEDHPLDPREAAELVGKLARGLSAVHHAGIVHRDIKPHNVMIDKDGQPLLMDFGLARQTTSDSHLTSSGAVPGTLAYMAPEQIESKPADFRSDIYSLGIVLYQALTGRLPFSPSEGPTKLILRITTENPPRPCKVRPELDPRLESICLKALAKSPAVRYQSAEELAEVLERYLRESPAALTRPSRRHHFTWIGEIWNLCKAAIPPRLRTRGWLVAAGGAALAGVLSCVLLTMRTREGTLVVEISDPEVTVQVLNEQGKLLIEQKAGAEKVEISVVPGKGKLRVVKNGVQLLAKEFSLVSGGRETINAKLETPVPPLLANASFDEKKAKEHQQSRAKALGIPVEITVDLGGGVKLEMVCIPAGEFLMGSPDSDKAAQPSEKPQHRVRITKLFYLGRYLVTQEQWQAVMGNNPSFFPGSKNPVEQVSWDDCQQFAEKLNAKVGGWKFSLPTEAQWEYACRAGSTTKYCFGDNESQLGEYAWYGANSGGMTHPVGKKKPNAWGLYDMHANVWQWCADWYDHDYYAKSPTDDPPGPARGWIRMFRGGSWCVPAGGCRSAYRRDYAARTPEQRPGFPRLGLSRLPSFGGQVGSATGCRRERRGKIANGRHRHAPISAVLQLSGHFSKRKRTLRSSRNSR